MQQELLLACADAPPTNSARLYLKMARTDLSPVTLLQQEIQTLTSAMRRNQRWASTSSSSFQSSNAPLPPAFHPKSGRRSRENSTGSRRSRQSAEGVEEGDLMVGFVDLRRTIAGVKGTLTLSKEDVSG